MCVLRPLFACIICAFADCVWGAAAVAGIEDLKEKREEVNKQIVKDEEEKQKIQNDLRMLTERLSRINDSLARKVCRHPRSRRPRRPTQQRRV